jgi:hypothetical protein
MKTLIALIAAVLLSPAYAQAFDFPSMPTDAPNESQWAIGMVQSACNVRLGGRGYHGTINRTGRGREVIYRVYSGNRLVASALASSKTIFAKKVCLRR